jgi:hypothetical protein
MDKAATSPPIAAGLIGLIVLADLLFWDHAPGLSLAVMAVAIFAVGTWDIRPLSRLSRPFVLLVSGVLPVTEYVQTLSVAFLVISLLLALVWTRAERFGDAMPGAVRLAMRVPLSGVVTLALGLRSGANLAFGAGPAGQPNLARAARNWAFPLGGSLVFAALLMDANPILANFWQIDLGAADLIKRGLIWPLVQHEPHDTRTIKLSKRLLVNLGINAESTLRALVAFNLIIGMQTWLDLTIFLGGADLPHGMTYAFYAHRGAYPLLATALLAGAFALAARPFLTEHHALKPLMLLWLAQNVALCLSALLRLETYINVYGLTYLRVHALIWMVLVAAGLALTAWQVWHERSNLWLFGRATALGLGVLYLCSFINFAGLIMQTNLQYSNRVDWYYLCSLDGTASAALGQAILADPAIHFRVRQSGCAISPYQPQGWQDWGFRNWRVARSLRALAFDGPTS